MNIIWIFAEPRSGSTALCELMVSQLNRIYFEVASTSVEKIIEMPYPEKYIFYTHDFENLKHLHAYADDLLLIRCIRRNKLEQCLSYLITDYINQTLTKDKEVWNLEINDTIEKQLKIFENAEPTIFTKKQVLRYLNGNSLQKNCWHDIAYNYNNFTIFYEDLCNGSVEIPALKQSFNIKDGSIEKLPSYKKKLCLNYQMVKKWVEEYYAQVVELADTQR